MKKKPLPYYLIIAIVVIAYLILIQGSESPQYIFSQQKPGLFAQKESAPPQEPDKQRFLSQKRGGEIVVPTYKDERYRFSNPRPSEDLTYDGLIELIKKNNVRSLPQLLSLLPKSIKSRYILMIKSKSAQLASEKYPRVILFSEKADLLMAFSGDPSDINHDLEIIYFNYETNEFEFSLISFPEDWSEAMKFLKKPFEIMRSPKSCISCHKSPGRPNWESYDFWPSAIGERDTFSKLEAKYLEVFAVTSKNHPLYKLLDHKKIVVPDYIRTLSFDLSTKIEILNRDRIIKYIRTSKDYKKFKYAILASLMNCNDAPLDHLPKSALPQSANWPELYRDTLSRYTKVFPLHKRLADNIPSGSIIMSNLRYLFETRGIKIDHWSTSFQEDYFFTAVPSIEFKSLASELYMSDADLNKKPLPYSDFSRFMDRGQPHLAPDPKKYQKMILFCQWLKKKSLESFK